MAGDEGKIDKKMQFTTHIRQRKNVRSRIRNIFTSIWYRVWYLHVGLMDRRAGRYEQHERTMFLNKFLRHSTLEPAFFVCINEIVVHQVKDVTGVPATRRQSMKRSKSSWLCAPKRRTTHDIEDDPRVTNSQSERNLWNYSMSVCHFALCGVCLSLCGEYTLTTRRDFIFPFSSLHNIHVKVAVIVSSFIYCATAWPVAAIFPHKNVFAFGLEIQCPLHCDFQQFECRFAPERDMSQLALAACRHRLHTTPPFCVCILFAFAVHTMEKDNEI